MSEHRYFFETGGNSVDQTLTQLQTAVRRLNDATQALEDAKVHLGIYKQQLEVSGKFKTGDEVVDDINDHYRNTDETD